MSILIKPLVTEKVTSLNDKGVFGFIVSKKANKVEIKKAVEKAYGVNVTDVRTMIIPGKPKSRQSAGKFVVGSTSPYKKALVSLSEGEVIDFYNGI
jgi:large subunit ribosomal protein L23